MTGPGAATGGMAPAEPEESRPVYHMHLFVAGDEPNSRRARENLERLCADHVPGECEIEITDVLVDFQEAIDAGIYVTPALLVNRTESKVTIFGNLSNTQKVLAALGLEETVDDR